MKKIITFMLCVCLCCGGIGSACMADGFPIPRILPALEAMIQGLSLAEKDYEATLDLPEQRFQSAIRQWDGVTEISVENLGQLQADERNIVLNANGAITVIDYASILRAIEDLTSGRQNARTTAYLESLGQKALEELVLPFAEWTALYDGFSLHIDADRNTFLTRLYEFLADLADDEEFLSVYNVIGPVLHESASDIPESGDALISFCRSMISRLNRTVGSWRLNADVFFSSGYGEPEGNLSGFIEVSGGSYTEHYPFSVDFALGEKGLTLRASARFPLFSFDLSYVGGQILAEFTDSRRYTCRLEGSWNPGTGVVDLLIYDSWNEEAIGSVKGSVLRDVVDVTARYYNDIIRAYARNSMNQLSIRFRSDPGDTRRYNSYDFDIRILKEDGVNYRVTVIGDVNHRTENLTMVIGPSRFSLKYTPYGYRTPMLNVSAQALGGGSRFDIRAEYVEAPGFRRSISQDSGIMIHLYGGGNEYQLEFSCPYESVKMNGSGSVTLGAHGELLAVSGQTKISDPWDPDGYRDMGTLTYVPGKLQISTAEGEYCLERTQDDDSTLVYELTQNTEPLYRLEISLTDTDQGTGLYASLADASGVLGGISVQPAEKEPVVPIDTGNALMINANNIGTILSGLLMQSW